jgi:hypothetical protein
MRRLWGLTQVEFLQTIRGYLQNRDGEYQTTVVLVSIASLIGLAWVLVIVYDRMARQNGRDDAAPQSLWDELCEAHALTATEVKLLEQAQLHYGDSGVMVFVDPRLLKGIESEGLDKTAVVQLGEKLFGPAYGKAPISGEPVGKFPRLSERIPGGAVS